MSIVLVGSTSGSVTLQEPAVAGTTVLDLPATSGTVLVGGTQNIPKSALPTGSVLQVVQSSTNGTLSTTNTSYTQTGLTATITPTSATSKVLVMIQTMVTNTSSSNRPNVTIYRNNTTNIISYAEGFTGQEWGASTGFVWSVATVSYLDSPASTSATTYTMYLKANSTGTAYAIYGGVGNYITLMEIAA